MRHDRLPRNAKLAARFKQQLARDRADEILRAAKRRRHDPAAEVEHGLAGEGIGAMARCLAQMRGREHQIPRHVALAVARILRVAADRSRLLDERSWEEMLPRLVRLAHHQSSWVREPEEWKPSTYNVARQFSAFARHLLARYDVPACFDEAWDYENAARRERRWFVHVGAGQNLRTAMDLPIPLTKLMAHHVMHAPHGVSLASAIRYGQCRGLGLGDRVARAVLGTRIGGQFFSDEQEAFWLTFLRWLTQHPMLDPAQIGPIADYVYDQRFVDQPPARVDGTFVHRGPAQPGLTMANREPDALLRQVEAWHRTLRRVRHVDDRLAWPTCGIAGYDRVEGESGNQRRFEIVELRSSLELRAEGSAMHHCVATYAHTCHSGKTAIFGLRLTDADGWQQRLTMEVRVRERQIVQARGRNNAMPKPVDERVLRAWATTAGLTISPHAWFAR